MDARQSPRSTVIWKAELEFAGGRVECIVLNIAPDGAGVRAACTVGLMQPVTLKSARFGAIDGVIAWQTDSELGIEFNEKQADIAAWMGGSLQPLEH